MVTQKNNTQNNERPAFKWIMRTNCIGFAICSFKSCQKGKPCGMEKARNHVEPKLKYGIKTCFQEVDKVMKGNEYWEELVFISGEGLRR